MSTTIGAKIALAGEKEFRQALTGCNTALKQCKAEANLLTKEFYGQQNTMEALTQRQKVLIKAYDQYCEKVDNAESALEKAKASQKSINEGLELARKELDKVNKALDNGSKTYVDFEGNTKDAAEAQKELKKEIAEGEANLRTNENRIAKWNLEMTNASADAADCANQLKDVQKYIEECGNSADGKATSIDEFGKVVEKTGDKGTSFKRIFGANFLAHLAVDAAKKAFEELKEAVEDTVKTGMEFEAQMSRVEAISGATGTEVDNLTEKAEQLGKSTVYTAEEAAEAMEQMSLAGWSAEEIIEGIDGVLDLAASSAMDVGEASEYMVDAIQAFGGTSSDASHYADVMAKAMSSSSMTTEELGEAYDKCATTASAFGFEMEDVTSVLALMANRGRKGSEAGASLNTIMTRLATNTKGCADALEEYCDGFELYDEETGKMADLPEILDAISSSWDHMTQEEQNNLAYMISGTRQISALEGIVAGLSDTVDDGGKSFNDYADSFRNCEGAASDMADTMLDNLSGDVQLASDAVDGLQIALYNAFSDEARVAVQGFTDVVNGIAGAIESTAYAASDAEKMIESLGDQAEESLGKAEDAANSAEEAIESIGTENGKIDYFISVLKELNDIDGLDTGQQAKATYAIEQLIDLIPELGDALDASTGSIKYTDEELDDLGETAKTTYERMSRSDASEKFQDSMASNSAAASEAKAAYEEALKAYQDFCDSMGGEDAALIAASQTVGQLHDKYYSLVSAVAQSKEKMEEAQAACEQTSESAAANEDALESLGGQYQATGDSIAEAGETADTTAQSISDSTNTLITSYTDLYATMEETMEGQIGLLNDMSEAYFDSSGQIIDENGEVTESLDSVKEEMQNDLQSQIEATEAWADSLSELAARGVDDGLLAKLAELGPEGAMYVQALNSMTDPELQSYEEKWQTLQDDLDMSGTVEDSLNSMAESLAGGGENLTSAMNEIGIDATEGFAAGMRSMIEEAKSASDETGDAVIDAIKTALDSHSPSRVMKQIGSDAVSGLTLGITSSLGVAAATAGMRALANKIVLTAKQSLGTASFTTVGKTVSAGIALGILSGQGSVSSAARNVAASATSGASAGINSGTFHSIGYQIPAGMASGINSGRAVVINSVANLCAQAVATARSRLKINSPSKVYAELGKFSAEGYAEGFESQMSDVNKTIASAIAAPSATRNTARADNGVLDLLNEYLPFIETMSKTYGKVVFNTKDGARAMAADMNYQLGLLARG